MDDFHDVKMPEEFTCGHQTRMRLYEEVHPRRFIWYGSMPPILKRKHDGSHPSSVRKA